MRAAIERIKRYLEMRKAQPGDCIHVVNASSEFEGELLLSDLNAVMSVYSGGKKEALADFCKWTKHHQADWPLGPVHYNGEFHHFMDPDTDTAWIGFYAGWTLRVDSAAD